MKKRLLSILLTACMLVGLLPTAAFAESGVNYLDWDTDQKTLVQKSYTETYTELTNENPGGTTWNAGWYVVTGDNVSISSRVTVNGDVHLILTDGCTLTVNGGIQVQDDDKDISNGSANALTIYAQSTGDNMGTLIANADGMGYPNVAGIGGGFDGGRCGTITINGGTVRATGTGFGAGIGSCGGTAHAGDNGAVTINGGIVTATGDCGAGIGSGACHGDGTSTTGSCGIITINGGTVTATSTRGDTGIGGSGGGTITISGNAVIFAESFVYTGDKTAWSGVIF